MLADINNQHPKYRILVIITNPENISQEQINFIYNYSDISLNQVDVVIVYELIDLENKFKESSIQYNFLYILGHGDENGKVVGGKDKQFAWSDFMNIIDNNLGYLNKHTIIFLHVCHGFYATEYIFNRCKRIKEIVCFKTFSINLPGYTSFISLLYHSAFLKKSVLKSVKVINKTIYNDIIYVKR